MKNFAFALAIAATSVAHADPLVLRADAFATSSAPAGLLTLSADGAAGPGLSADALVWMGKPPSPGDGAIGDVLVIALRARTADGFASGTVGRFVSMLGALRPVQIDGASGRVRLPQRIDVEAMAGIPVLPDLTTSRTWDWVAGGRVSRRLGDWGSMGVAYLEQRDDGRLVTEEAGLDAGLALAKHSDLAAKLAYDLANPGIAEAGLVASHRQGALRTDLFATYRAASHILPATSLFSVFGDVPAERLGTTFTWRAAPRLEIAGDAGVRHAIDATAPELAVRARLLLDARGASAITGELRRDGVGADEWTGARGAARLALPASFAFSSELELVIADKDRGLGRVWPWGILALSRDVGGWQAAIAVEASASPQDRHRVDVLAQLGRRWGIR